MGYYINNLPNGKPLTNTRKAEQLLSIPGAIMIPQPLIYDKEIHKDKLVCVVSNCAWEAAGYCYDQREFEDFTSDTDDRPKIWMLIPDADILSGFKKAAAKSGL